MERLQRAGGLIVLLILGVVIVSLIAGFQSAIAQPVALIGGIVLGAGMILILLRAALVPESRYTGWVRSITGRNGRYLFGVLLVGWVIGMALLASLGLPPNQNGAPALVMLFAGFFVFMGFIWSVIGE